MKVINKSELMINSSIDHLKREIKIQKKLDHPHIVKLYHYLEDKDHVYLILEYAPNGNLFFYLRKKKKLTEKEAFIYFLQTCVGIDYLHKKGIVHRDLKPENLLLDKQGNIKLCDFGWSAEDIGKRNTFCGTVDYMAPEMIQNKAHDFRIDIWSLGVLLYELLHGCPPFKGKNASEKFHSILEAQIIFENISPEARNLISSLLRAEPNDRPAFDFIFNHEWMLKYEKEFKISIKDFVYDPLKKKLKETSKSANSTPRKGSLANQILPPKQEQGPGKSAFRVGLEKALTSNESTTRLSRSNTSNNNANSPSSRAEFKSQSLSPLNKDNKAKSITTLHDDLKGPISFGDLSAAEGGSNLAFKKSNCSKSISEIDSRIKRSPSPMKGVNKAEELIQSIFQPRSRENSKSPKRGIFAPSPEYNTPENLNKANMEEVLQKKQTPQGTPTKNEEKDEISVSGSPERKNKFMSNYSTPNNIDTQQESKRDAHSQEKPMKMGPNPGSAIQPVSPKVEKKIFPANDAKIVSPNRVNQQINFPQSPNEQVSPSNYKVSKDQDRNTSRENKSQEVVTANDAKNVSPNRVNQQINFPQSPKEQVSPSNYKVSKDQDRNTSRENKSQEGIMANDPKNISPNRAIPSNNLSQSSKEQVSPTKNQRVQEISESNQDRRKEDRKDREGSENKKRVEENRDRQNAVRKTPEKEAFKHEGDFFVVGVESVEKVLNKLNNSQVQQSYVEDFSSLTSYSNIDIYGDEQYVTKLLEQSHHSELDHLVDRHIKGYEGNIKEASPPVRKAAPAPVKKVQNKEITDNVPNRKRSPSREKEFDEFRFTDIQSYLASYDDKNTDENQVLEKMDTFYGKKKTRNDTTLDPLDEFIKDFIEKESLQEDKVGSRSFIDELKQEMLENTRDLEREQRQQQESRSNQRDKKSTDFNIKEKVVKCEEEPYVKSRKPEKHSKAKEQSRNYEDDQEENEDFTPSQRLVKSEKKQGLNKSSSKLRVEEEVLVKRNQNKKSKANYEDQEEVSYSRHNSSKISSNQKTTNSHTPKSPSRKNNDRSYRDQDESYKESKSMMKSKAASAAKDERRKKKSTTNFDDRREDLIRQYKNRLNSLYNMNTTNQQISESFRNDMSRNTESSYDQEEEEEEQSEESERNYKRKSEERSERDIKRKHKNGSKYYERKEKERSESNTRRKYTDESEQEEDESEESEEEEYEKPRYDHKDKGHRKVKRGLSQERNRDRDEYKTKIVKEERVVKRKKSYHTPEKDDKYHAYNERMMKSNQKSLNASVGKLMKKQQQLENYMNEIDMEEEERVSRPSWRPMRPMARREEEDYEREEEPGFLTKLTDLFSCLGRSGKKPPAEKMEKRKERKYY